MAPTQTTAAPLLGAPLQEAPPPDTRPPADLADDDQLLAAVALDDPVRKYLCDIGRVPLLSAAEEIALAQRIAAGVVAAAQLAQAPEATHRAALQQTVADGHAARDHLIRANLRLVVAVAKKYHAPQFTLLDLVQEGNLGLMRAVEKFDATKGHKFSTYATWWIRQAITRAIADQSRTIRLPVHMGEQISQIRQAERVLAQQLGRDPTPGEVAAAIGVAEARVTTALQAAQQPLSLAMPLTDDGEELGSVVADAHSTPPDVAAAVTLLREALAMAVAQLPPREQQISTLRYGLEDGQYRTLEEVGQHFGVTRERIRQIEAIALRKLRHPHLGRQLRGFWDER